MTADLYGFESCDRPTDGYGFNKQLLKAFVASGDECWSKEMATPEQAHNKASTLRRHIASMGLPVRASIHGPVVYVTRTDRTTYGIERWGREARR